LGEEARCRILAGTFEDWRRGWLDRYHRGDT